MSYATRTTIDGAGRVVIPKPIREAAGLSARDVIDIRICDGGVIELQPVPRAVRIEDVGGLKVAVPDDSGEALEEETVARTVSALRGRGH